VGAKATYTCPNCDAKITQKDYDATFEWYECPKCEACHTFDELIETRGRGNEKPGAAKKRSGNAKGNRGGSSVRGSSSSGSGASQKPVAKAKKKQAEIADDEQAEADRIESLVANTVKTNEISSNRKDEVPTGEVVNIMADELVVIYSELGGRLDDANARDKALTLWRELHYKDGIHAREKAVEHALCGVHS
jgi:hypothetical protein